MKLRKKTNLTTHLLEAVLDFALLAGFISAMGFLVLSSACLLSRRETKHPGTLAISLRQAPCRAYWPDMLIDRTQFYRSNRTLRRGI
jgi:hypothetical protein